jgi:hypothetical protein
VVLALKEATMIICTINHATGPVEWLSSPSPSPLWSREMGITTTEKKQKESYRMRVNIRNGWQLVR